MTYPSRASIYNLVSATVSKQLNRPEHGISEASDLLEDLQADSLDIVELVLEFEEMFNVEIPDSDLEQLHSVGDYVNLIEKKVSSMNQEQEVPQEEVVETPVETTDAPVVSDAEPEEADGEDEED